MSASEKINGESSKDESGKDESSPRPQRKPRINRRGFYLSNQPLKKLSSDDTETQAVNGINANKSTLDSSSKRTISLKSITSSSNEQKVVKDKESCYDITLKRNAVVAEGKSDKVKISISDDPPKKKHKPITWP